MNVKEILTAAKAAPEKQHLEEYRESVEILRDKGFTWREIAEFLSERGVPTDHTRVYRMFGKSKEGGIRESREIEVSRVTFVGERTKGNKKTWNVMEIELPTRFGHPIVVKGFAWGAGSLQYKKGEDDSLNLRNPSLKVRSKAKGFPMACINAEFKMNDGEWVQQEVHIVPKWEAIL